MPTWTECCWPECESRDVEDSDGLPLCRRHYDVVTSRYVGNIQLRSGFRKQANAVVYYVRIGDHIKIGFTTQLKSRMYSLYVEPLDLLATEPGGRTLEADRHRQFAAERVSPQRELFEPSPRLLAHIVRMADEPTSRHLEYEREKTSHLREGR